ncbi:MAG: NAD(P)/FAD-dependent oxidoreductase [Aestuariivita sp.]|uniref:flavin monoamine oxidase family protein n=1 Tax=Aestuariivita sp. TaxID=1872407 RepID=UPI003BAFA258
MLDVVIVGAGAAGVGAGLALQAAGKSFVILEAADRIGGRAFTDKATMELPWDQGCHWLHCADVNPLVPWADKVGTRYIRQTRRKRFMYWLHDRWAGKDWVTASNQHIEEAFGAVYEAARADRDIPVSEVLPDAGAYGPGVRHLLQLMASEDPELESASGYGDYADTEVNWPVLSGYGDLIERMAQGLPIRTGVPVSAISEQPGGVRVETPEGPVEARSAIVTVSTNVLNSGAIRFSSPEVQPVLETVQHVPCGSYEKVAIGLRRPLPGLVETQFFSIEPAGASPINVQLLDWSDKMVIVHIGGGTAREAGRDGPDGLRAFVTERIKLAFGADIMDEVTATAPTGWQDNPFVQGAYSAVRPGFAQARRDLIGLHSGRIGFAGEMFSLHWQATAHGAYQTGQDVAARMIAHELS